MINGRPLRACAAHRSSASGAIAFRASLIGAVDEFLGLPRVSPPPWSLLLDAGHLVDAGGHRRIEQPVGGRFPCQFFYGRQTLIDGGRSVALALKRGAVRLHGSAGEGGTSLLYPPLEKIP
jgi:hypothetical protein